MIPGLLMEPLDGLRFLPPALSPYVFSVFAGRANGAGTLVRSKIGRRRSLEISKRGSALPAFLRDKSRAPGGFLVGALNRYAQSSEPCRSWLQIKFGRTRLSALPVSRVRIGE